MTTAHRPTWKAAVGQASEGGYGLPSSARSVLDEAAHTKLKVRKGHQKIATSETKEKVLQESLRKLQEAEAKLKSSKANHNLLIEKRREVIPAIEAEGRMKLSKQTVDVNEKKVREKYKDLDADFGNDDDDDSNGWSDVDSNNDESELDENDSDLDESDDDSDEDEEAALQAELAKIRAERAAVKAKQEAEIAMKEEARMEKSALVGNPLLVSSSKTSGKLKRRWNDDVVFRNQAKNEPDRNQKRFINDTVRNDFHKRFLNKFIL